MVASKASYAADSGGFPWFAVAFVSVYAAVAAAAMPVAPLAYGAGAVFGFWRACAFIWMASMLGAAGGYTLARTVWAAPARRLLGRYRDRVHQLGRSNVILTAMRMQLLPFIPFGVFNYAAAIAGLPLVRFLVGTAIGIIPGTVAAALVGDRLVAGLRGEGGRPFVVALTVAAALVALSFAPTIVRRTRHQAE